MASDCTTGVTFTDEIRGIRSAIGLYRYLCLAGNFAY